MKRFLFLLLLVFAQPVWSAPMVVSDLRSPVLTHRVDTLADAQGLVGSSALKALRVEGRTVAGDGYAGTFYWLGGNQSANPQVLADTEEGEFIVPTTPGDGSTGVWVRQFSGPLDVRWFGAKGDFDYGTLTGTDNRTALQAALLMAQRSEGGKAVLVPGGQYLIDTGGGTILIPEGVELFGEGGVQTRVPTVESQATNILIRGTTNEAFEYERGTFVRNIRIDYPDQAEDPVAPTTYPACFTKGASSGSRSFFQNIIFDRTYWAFDSSGATFWNNVHGTIYRRFIRISDSAALNNIVDCSNSAVWHMGALTNTKIFTQENLVFVEVVGGTDGLSLMDCKLLAAKSLLVLNGGDNLNFFQASNVLCDGVPNVVVTDGTVQVLSMHFSNCKFGALNDVGSTFGNEVFDFNFTRQVSYPNRNILFSNCEFRNARRNFFTIDGDGIDVLKFTGCSFFNWNSEDVNIATYGAIYANYAELRLTLAGCSFNNKPQLDDTINSSALVIQSAEAVTLVGNDHADMTYSVRYGASATLTDGTFVGNTGSALTAGFLKPGTETITNEVAANNNWP